MIHSQTAKRACTGFQFLEGPVWVGEGSPLLTATDACNGGLIFSDIPANRLYWLAGDRTGIVREATGQANGNALDSDGRLLSCEHDARRVSRLDGTGVVSCVVDRYAGKRLNSPNDIAVRGDGIMFFTDPPYGVRNEDRELTVQGVYCLHPASADPVLLADNFIKPNGLAFSVDEKQLYVADTEMGHVRRFAVAADGSLSEDYPFCQCERPDGMCVDLAGNVWVACMEGVEVFDIHGHSAGFIHLPERPANLAFGDADMKTVYICARTSIYKVRSDIAGALGRSVSPASETVQA